MQNQQQKVGAISSFLDQLKKITTEKDHILYYRGHSKSSFKLEPSIYRNQGWIQNEAEMLKDLILRCPNDFSSGLSTLQSLVKMQHYGLPTRLLDITSNPLVALYFACETNEDNNEDGEVIVFNYKVDQVKYFDSDTAAVVANLCRRPLDFIIPNLNDKSDFNASEEIKLLLHDIRQDKPHFEPAILRTDFSRVVCVKPILDNPRIIRQEGAFLLFGCNGRKQQPANLETETISEIIIINRDKKIELSRQLETLGISKATLFPEIEHVARHIKNTYFTPTIQINNLSEAQRKVFLTLKIIENGTTRDIALKSNMTSSSVGHIISKLLEIGLIESFGSGRNQRWRIRENTKIIEDPTGKAADQ
jgi:hypothetical protein